MGIDLVRLQIEIAQGRSLEELGFSRGSNFEARGFAIQARVNLETLGFDGSMLPSGGTLSAFDPPTGRGIRVDSFGYTGYRTSPHYDSLLAKVIAHAPSGDFQAVVDKCYRALCEFRIEGSTTNLGLLQALLQDRPEYYFAFQAPKPEAVQFADEPESSNVLRAPLQGTVVSIAVQKGDLVRKGQPLLVMEAMKMETEVQADRSGVVQRVAVAVGETVLRIVLSCIWRSLSRRLKS